VEPCLFYFSGTENHVEGFFISPEPSKLFQEQQKCVQALCCIEGGERDHLNFGQNEIKNALYKIMGPED